MNCEARQLIPLTGFVSKTGNMRNVNYENPRHLIFFCIWHNKIKMNKNFTWPNLLSLLRLMMIPLILHLILNINDRNYFLLIAFYLLTIMLDFFDGFLARKLGQESELGKILDPLADKLLMIAILFCLILRSDFPIWLALLVITRDLMILLASLFLFRGKGMIKPSILIGKVTFALLSLLIFFTLSIYTVPWTCF